MIPSAQQQATDRQRGKQADFQKLKEADVDDFDSPMPARRARAPMVLDDIPSDSSRIPGDMGH